MKLYSYKFDVIQQTTILALNIIKNNINLNTIESQKIVDKNLSFLQKINPDAYSNANK